VSLARVLIVDDHRVVVEGFVRLLSDQYEIVGTITDARRALDAIAESQPDVVLLDISMPYVSGFRVLNDLRARGHTCKVIVLTMHADPNLAVEALKGGASGFLLKESSGEELVSAIQSVLTGCTYLASGLTKEILTLMVGAADPNRLDLTAQQREVLRLIVKGRRAKEIAGTLELSTRSVEAIKYRLMQQLNVHSTAELVRYAVEHNVVPF
jgi:DNA-binding NarL/FixJ family response regulator